MFWFSGLKLLLFLWFVIRCTLVSSATGLCSVILFDCQEMMLVSRNIVSCFFSITGYHKKKCLGCYVFVYLSHVNVIVMPQHENNNFWDSPFTYITQTMWHYSIVSVQISTYYYISTNFLEHIFHEAFASQSFVCWNWNACVNSRTHIYDRNKNTTGRYPSILEFSDI